LSRDRLPTLSFEISAADYDRLNAAYILPSGTEARRARSLLAFLDTPDGALRDKGIAWCFERKEKQKNDRLKPGDWRVDDDHDSRSFVKKNRLRSQIGGVFTARIDLEEAVASTNGIEADVILQRIALRNGAANDIYFEARLSLREGEEGVFRQFIGEILPGAKDAIDEAGLIARGYRLAEQANGDAPSDGRPDVATETIAKEEAKEIGAKEVGAKEIGAKESEAKPVAQKGPGVFETFLSITRRKIVDVLAAPQPIDFETIEANIKLARDVHVSLRFFSNTLGITDLDQSLKQIGEWESALTKVREVERVYSRSLKKAMARSVWEGASNIAARIGDVRRRSYVVLVQTWPLQRVKNLFAGASDIIERQVAAGFRQGDGGESLAAFLDREMPHGIEHIETLGYRLLSAGQRQSDADLALLREAISRLASISSFFESFASGKAARRLASFLEALDHLSSVLDRNYELSYAQDLVNDAATHIMRLRQTKTQTTQIFAAGALIGFFEAMKAEKFDKALRQALADLADVKPFWTKIDWPER